jgi:hypothetical protein
MFLKKIKFFCFFCILFISALGDTAWADEFSDIMGDVPLMAGLIEDVDQRLVFDKPEGRIVQTVVFGHVFMKDARGFYLGLLPELGWAPDGITTEGLIFNFVREGEILELRFLPNHNEITIYFNLSPNSE